MLKKVLAAALVIITPYAFAHELKSFDEILDAISSGKQVSAVIHYHKCKVEDPNEIKLPSSSAVVKIATAFFSEERISFDANKYTQPLSNVAPNGLNHRASLILEKNGNFNGMIAMFDAVTNLKLATRKDISFSCKLGENVKFFKN